MLNASHAFWSATAESGMDRVIDDVWVLGQQPIGLNQSLSGANVLWVGLHCPLPVLEQRERSRGDRRVGTVRGHHALVHSFRDYDVNLDTSVLNPEECAAAVVKEVRVRFPGVL
jgi:chloramphenicol 3-O phosphotransferase